MKTDSSKLIFTGLGLVLGFYILAVILQPIVFTNRFGANSEIAGVNVSYMSAASAQTKLEQAYSAYLVSKVDIGGNNVLVSDYVVSSDVPKTVNDALLQEQSGYFGFSKLTKQVHSLELKYNDAAISKLILPAYNKSAVAPVDANIKIASTTTVIPEKSGQRLLLPESKANIMDGLSAMNTNIGYRVADQAPELTAVEAQSVIRGAEANLSEPITLLGDGVSYTIKASDLHNWLHISSAKPKTLVAIENFEPPISEYYYLDQAKVFSYVDTLAKSIDKAAVNAKLAAVDGKVVVATPEQIGQTVDRKDATNQIQLAVTGDRTATLKITAVKPDIRADNLATLGLKELVATGQSDFTGSPVNRIHNVAAGASKFNGVLIKPGEDFSFNKALGPVDASTGYLPELVILADKTVPEYGGGLCQVSSTAFRAALNAGLPILERHAHAYPVGYYKPYGVDATIYLPTPDMRFKNDTGAYIFVQTRIEGKKLYFDFYGTKKPVVIKFSGNAEATGAVDVVENVNSTLTELGVRGKNSFTAVFYRHIYDAAGKLTDNDKFTSKYESPDKYPH
jgi:vancomycin resistance protein YoaR